MRGTVFVIRTLAAMAIGENDVRGYLETARLQPIGPRRRRPRQQAYGPDAGQRTLVRFEPRIARREPARIEARIGVAEQHRIVSVRSHLLRPVGVARVERSAIGPR